MFSSFLLVLGVVVLGAAFRSYHNPICQILANWKLGTGIRRRLFVVPFTLAGDSHPNPPDAPAARSLFSRENAAPC